MKKLHQTFAKWASFLVILLTGSVSIAKEFHVAKNGSDTNDGSTLHPFVTINAAARLALAGDVVTVHAGTYREWVNPINGGTSDTCRIIYQAAPNEEVFIKGSEVIKGWKEVGDGVWKVFLTNSNFGDYNPYQDVIFGDWFESRGRDHHTGEVYLNGKSFYEVESLAKVQSPQVLKFAKDKDGSLYTWFTESDAVLTTIWANFHDKNPNDELVEINVRPTCFFAKALGVNYVAVRGFHLSQAATQWAPPTAEQIGLIGAHWSKGWIIENNVISDSKCSGVSLGKERASGQNYGMTKKMKSGFQYQLEAVFKALQLGWNKDNVGSHIVRNNTIYNCEQAGIVGNLGAVFSQVYSNHIYNIWMKRQFDGSEQAGIKFHAPIDVTIRNNRIHDCGFGIWMDWQAQGTRITRNLLYKNDKDLMVEVSHGPFVVDNNFLLSPFSLDLYSAGGAFAYNLVAGKLVVNTVLNRAVPYHYPHSTAVSGTAFIVGGDDRFFNNVFVSDRKIETAGSQTNAPIPEAAKIESSKSESYGLSAYNGYPGSMEDYQKLLAATGGFYVSAFNKVKQPVYISGNLYYGESAPYDREVDFIKVASLRQELKVEENASGVYLELGFDESMAKIKTKPVTSQSLGMPRIVEAAYENPDGSPLVIDVDYFGAKRSEVHPTVGPVECLGQGNQRLKVW